MMRDSETVVAVADRLRGLLDDRLLRNRVDAPIDRVSEPFRAGVPSSPSTKVVHDTLARLVQALYAEALRCPLHLSFSESMAEALSLLAQGYQSPSGERGYEAALVDAVWSGPNGFSFVVTAVADLIKQRERQKWIRWAIVECLYTLDQTTLSEMSQAMWRRVSEFLPPGAQGQPPLLTVDTLARAIIDDVRLDGALQGILDSAQ